MSRRREAVRKALDWIEREQAVEHYEPLPGDPELPQGRPWVDDWQTAWAETTLSVAEVIWHDMGARMYHGQGMLYDDLYGWLIVEAQTLANGYSPRWNVPSPERTWGAYLWTTLRARARWHFASTIGTRNPANHEAHSQMDSRDARIEAMISRSTPAGALRFEAAAAPLAAWRPLGPERHVLLMETIEEQIDGDGCPASVRARCSWEGCDKPAPPTVDDGFCDYHRRKTKELWDGGNRCSIDDCPDRASTRGLCRKHYTTESARLAREGLRWDGTPRPACSEPDCQSPATTRGLCNRCYLRARAAERSAA